MLRVRLWMSCLAAIALVACGDDEPEGTGTVECPAGQVNIAGECVPTGFGPDVDGPDIIVPDTPQPDEGGPDVPTGAVALPFAVDDYFIPSGFMGDGETPGNVTAGNDCPQRAGEQAGACHAFSYTGSTQGWAGVIWQYPEGNWGNTGIPGLEIADGATQVTFWAWGAAGGETVTFQAGLGDVDGFSGTEEVTLTTTPTQYSVLLVGQTYSDVVGGFGWTAPAAAGGSLGFYVDDIQWTDAPTGDVLGCTDEGAANYNAAATADDGSCEYNVTFQVDMSEETLADGDVVYLEASFNEWCGLCNPMADEDADGVWTLTVPLAPGDYEYKFAINGFDGTVEDVPLACDVTGGANGNRGVTVPAADLVIPVVAFGGCTDELPSVALPFWVEDHYIMSGYMGGGTVDSAECDAAPADSAAGTCRRVTWTPAADPAWVGFYFQYPADNWGEAPGLPIAPGATKVTFKAWGELGGERANFGTGINDADGFQVETGFQTLTAEPQEFTISLSGVTYTEVIGAFAWYLENPDAASSVTIYIDDVQWSDEPLGELPGCTDDDATNYDADAVTDDGSCLYGVTFQVEMSGEDLQAGDVVHVHGTFNDWCDGCNPLADDDGDGVWSVTLPLPVGAFEYKYTINSWGGTEETVPPECDVVEDPAFANRGAEVVDAPLTLELHAFGACPGDAPGAGCTNPNANNYDPAASEDNGTCVFDVTFQVDVSEEGLAAGDVVHVHGEFNDWCDGCAPMADDDGDGVWTLVIPLAAGTYEYKYTINSWAGTIETVPQACNLSSDPAFDNRAVTVVDDAVVIDAHPFGACEYTLPGDGCTDDDATNYDPDATNDDGSCLYEVTFQIDMNDQALAAGDVVHLHGTFNGWCDGCNPLADDEGDGVWTLTLPIPVGVHEYKYTINSWAGTQEDVPPACDVVEDPAFSNRGFEVVDMPLTLPIHGFGTCPGVEGEGCTDPDALNYDPDATVDDGSCDYGLSQVDLPITFDDPTVDYAVEDFGGTATTIVEDPTAPGNFVASTTKSGTAETWAGTTASTPAGLASPIPFTAANTKLSVRVYSPDAGIPVRVKVEDASDSAISVETEAVTTMADAWETLEFDFAPGSEAPGTAAIDFANTYDKLSIFFNFGTSGVDAGEKTYWWDDVEFVGAGVDVPGCTDPIAENYDPAATLDDGSCTYAPQLAQVELPITFDDPTVDYTVTDFGGTATTIVEDPTMAGNFVASTTKSDTAELWAGVTASTDDGLATPIPFSATNTKMTVRVYSPDAGIPVRLKVEDAGNPTVSVETEATTTLANTWETLEFDFAPGNEAAGTAAIGFANTYDKVSIFFNFGTTGADAGEKTYWWDDVEFAPEGPHVPGCTDPAAENYDPAATLHDGSCTYPPMLDQVDLPITFDDPAVDYTMTDFGGNATTVVEDPTMAGNMVAQSIKTDSAEVWAGTTASTDDGLANPIPLAANQTVMTVRVWSPDAGVPVRLKVENSGNAAVSVETEAVTTLAAQWETLQFDFAAGNEVAGTPAINYANVYDKVSIFFDFGTSGADAGEKTYYWDDVDILPPTDDVPGCMAPGAANYDPAATIDDGSCLFDVTFQVDMSAQGLVAGDVVQVQATFNGFCGTCNPLSDDDGDGIWTVTLPIPAGVHEYLYTINSWEGVVEDVPEACDVVAAPEINNRGFEVVDQAVVLDLHAFGECPAGSVIEGCTNAGAANYNPGAEVDDGSCQFLVTFSVDMSAETLAAGDVVHVHGTFNGWCDGCNPLADDDGDGVWTLTLPIANGVHEYKYTINSWAGVVEGVPAACDVVPDPAFDNRGFELVDADLVLPVHAFGECPVIVGGGCTDPDATNYDDTATADDGSCTYEVTFTVDMSAVALLAGDVVYVNGDFNGWCGDCNPMADNADGTWSVVLPIPVGTYQYKFTINGWDAQESVPAECNVNTEGFENRGMEVVDAPLMLPVVAYGMCPASSGGDAIIAWTFDDMTSISGWNGVANAADEGTIAWSADGNGTGAIEFSAVNASTDGKAYIFEYLDPAFDWMGATDVRVTFDLKGSVFASAVHLQTEIPGIGVTNNFDLQAQGLNPDTWTSYTFDFNGVDSATAFFRIHFNFAAGAVMDAGGTLLVDNLVVTPL